MVKGEREFLSSYWTNRFLEVYKRVSCSREITFHQLEMSSTNSSSSKRNQQQHRRQKTPILSTPPAPKKSKKVNMIFNNFSPDFNGYQCHFLKRENYQQLKFFSSAMCITRNDSLAIFHMPDILRGQLADKVDHVLTAMEEHEQVQRHNPFKDGSDSTVFIRLSPTTIFFVQTPTGEVKATHRNDLVTGKCYNARVAVTLKGVKLDKKTQVLSPMLVPSQVLIIELAQQQQQADIATCILTAPLCDEDNQLTNTAATTDNNEGYEELFKDISETELNNLFA